MSSRPSAPESNRSLAYSSLSSRWTLWVINRSVILHSIWRGSGVLAIGRVIRECCCYSPSKIIEATLKRVGVSSPILPTDLQEAHFGRCVQTFVVGITALHYSRLLARWQTR